MRPQTQSVLSGIPGRAREIPFHLVQIHHQRRRFDFGDVHVLRITLD
jgi:hypothetical protein